MKLGVLRFPGTNCDRDIFGAVENAGFKAEWLWHEDQFEAAKYGALFLPGGFSYGDYLRSGALAARAPAMISVREAAKRGTPILGVCNGFQILCEAGLLPGALVRNEGRRFKDTWVDLEVQNPHAQFAAKVGRGACLHLPIAHADGRYFVEPDVLPRLQDKGQVWLTYRSNPNGSVADIAGVMNEKKNVAGLMPHPERAIHTWMGGVDGQSFFQLGER